MGSDTNKRKSSKRGIFTVLVVLLAVVLVVLLSVTIFASHILNKINRADDLEPMSQEQIDAILKEEMESGNSNLEGEEASPEGIDLPEVPVDTVATGDDILNLLLVGQDTANVSQRSRTDSMILCTINKSTGTLTMTSFMRDTYVKIPDFYNQRLNVAYLVGGFDALYNTLEHNFGVQVDMGVAVNFASFQQVIDKVGGVEVALTAAEADYLNGNHYTWGLVEGMNTLDGEKALAYSRIRSLQGGDFNRTNRQRAVVMALFSKAKTMPIKDLYNLVEALIPMVVTDMSNAEIISVAVDVMPLLQDLEIVSQRIPVDDGYYMTMVDGMSVLIPDLDVNRQYLVDTIGVK